MRIITLIFLASLISTISACSLIPRVIINSYDIVGRVVDNDTNEPIQGVRVTARTEFGNASGARSVLQGVAYTNAQGEFDIPQNPIDISSYQKYIMPNPSLDFEKEGYCLLGIMSGKEHWTSQNITKLNSPDGNCKVYQNIQSELQ